MRRLVLLSCALVALVAVPQASASHSATECHENSWLLETQAWWNPMPGPATHPGTGKTGHVHLSNCFPLHGTLSAPLTLPSLVQLHDHPRQAGHRALERRLQHQAADPRLVHLSDDAL